MAIHSPERFRQAQPANFDGVFEWDFLSGCFPRGIMPMDFDAVVEIGGHFLVFETKEPGKKVDIGQAQAFKKLLRNPAFTVFMLWGKTPQTITKLVVRHGTDTRTAKVIDPATVEDVRREATTWAERCDRTPMGPLSIAERREIFEKLQGVDAGLKDLMSIYSDDDFKAEAFSDMQKGQSLA